jgi:hypothetical protein
MSRIPGKLLFLAFVAVLTISPLAAMATQPANDAFYRTWERTERPVSDQVANRTWMWGPIAITSGISEPYEEAPGGYRDVQYFDKTRMEINNPLADPDSLWYVTNGLLAKELITGQLQTGHLTHIEIEPSRSPVAGDRHPNSPTYFALSHLLDEPPREVDTIITEKLTLDDDEFGLDEDDELSHHEVRAGYHVPETDRTVAEPFWEFMNSSGFVREGGVNVQGKLFEDPFFATGFPITEAYWAHIPVGGEWRDVLLQCFERRCLTYTPDNPDGWQVEAGNIGRHYHEFRYGRPPEILDCVELNLSATFDLVRIDNIGESRAQTIMEHRPFDSVEDLERVPGIGPATVETIKEQGLACVVYDPGDRKDFHQLR